jgi:proteic killer suppression protein
LTNGHSGEWYLMFRAEARLQRRLSIFLFGFNKNGREGLPMYNFSTFSVDDWRCASYDAVMIKSFKCKDTEKLFNDLDVKKFRSVSRIARIKLEVLNATVSLSSLRIPPGNRLEQLKGNRKDQYSIRVNDQWRICFRWTEECVHDVEIVDYHKG